jgi:hypothetical protein
MITIYYSCPDCGLDNVPVEVAERTTEDVIQWFEGILTPALMGDHYGRSPDCHPASLKEIKIPITGADKIGGPCVN